jgi:hypothetical protein
MLTSPELENLVRIGKLKREPPSVPEFEGLLRSGAARLADELLSELIEAARVLLAAVHALQPPKPQA